jgi:acyl-CoA synthetase (AMP-forming)/AMP-acid ligase II
VVTAICKYPGIVDATVYGVALPNHDGRAGCAAILTSSPTLDFSDLAAHLKQSLPSFAVPLFLRITKELRLTGNMKHQKHELKEEGVDLSKVNGECVYWLRDGGYKQFTLDDWKGINRGLIRL